MILDTVAAVWYLSPFAVALLVVTASFALGVGLGKLFLLGVDRRARRHL